MNLESSTTLKQSIFEIGESCSLNEFDYFACIYACMVLKVMFPQMHICMHGSQGYVSSNAYMHAWFSRLCFLKCIYACMVLKVMFPQMHICMCGIEKDMA